jgi:hypothetical protein
MFRSRLRPGLYLRAALLVALPVLVALPQHAAPQTASGTLVFAVDPAQSTVHWTLGSSLHTVHGTFALKRGSFRVDPATSKAGGEIVVDATSGKSGNDGRDRKMHKDVLESARSGGSESFRRSLERGGEIQRSPYRVGTEESKHLAAQGGPLRGGRVGTEGHGSSAGAIANRCGREAGRSPKRFPEQYDRRRALKGSVGGCCMISGCEHRLK